MTPALATRLAAALIALTAWAGLAVQWIALLSPEVSALRALLIMAGYFTILTNLLVALLFSAIALHQSRHQDDPRHAHRSASLLAGTTLSILLVGVVYALLLHGLLQLSGGSALANFLLHRVTPILVPLFWILCQRRRQLLWSDPLLWAIYPLLYLGYVLLHGAATHRYPYPFVDLTVLGWPRVLGNAALIAIGFLLAGFALVWLDHRLPDRSPLPLNPGKVA